MTHDIQVNDTRDETIVLCPYPDFANSPCVSANFVND